MFTYSERSTMEWLTSTVTVLYWEYEQLEDGCAMKDPAPVEINTETEVIMKAGICAIKYQVINTSDIVREITVLSNNAIVMGTSAVMIALSALLF